MARPPPEKLNPLIVTVVPPQRYPRWTTYSGLAMAIGLTEKRLWDLRKSFFACPTINKFRNLRHTADRDIFCSEVKEWLEGDLSCEDRKNIFGRENLSYPASYALYQVAMRFKIAFLVSSDKKAKKIQHRVNQAAAPTTHALSAPSALAPSASALSGPSTPTQALTAVSKASATSAPSPRSRGDVSPVGQIGKHLRFKAPPSQSTNLPPELQSPEREALLGMKVSKLKRIIKLATTIRNQANAITKNATDQEWKAVRTNQAKLEEILGLGAGRSSVPDAYLG